MTLPRVTLEGGLTRDPEMRFTGKGMAVTNVTIACKDRVRDSNGQWTDGDATFVDVTVWGKQAENLIEGARRGDTLVVSGYLKQENWEKEGEKRSKLAVTAEAIGVSLLWPGLKSPRANGEYETGSAPPKAPLSSDDEPPF